MLFFFSRCGRALKRWQLEHPELLNESPACTPKNVICVQMRKCPALLFTLPLARAGRGPKKCNLRTQLDLATCMPRIAPKKHGSCVPKHATCIHTWQLFNFMHFTLCIKVFNNCAFQISRLILANAHSRPINCLYSHTHTPLDRQPQMVNVEIMQSKDVRNQESSIKAMVDTV